jgi:hypothetical protein
MFQFGFSVIFLVCLIRALVMLELPFVWAGLFAAFAVARRAFVHGPSWQILLSGFVAFAVCSIYFWLLNRFSESMLWWLILIVGFPIVVVF